jgi:hypothetical protein
MRPFRKVLQILLAIVVSLAFAVTGWTQDASSPEEASEEVETDTRELPAPEPDTEDIDVDDGSYLDGEEDDFRPSEEIPADQSIPFPTDI